MSSAASVAGASGSRVVGLGSSKEILAEPPFGEQLHISCLFESNEEAHSLDTHDVPKTQSLRMPRPEGLHSRLINVMWTGRKYDVALSVIVHKDSCTIGTCTSTETARLAEDGGFKVNTVCASGSTPTCMDQLIVR